VFLLCLDAPAPELVMRAPGPSPIHHETNVRPLSKANLLPWVWKTVRRDVKRYRAPRRGWSLGRLARSIRPRIERPVFLVGALGSGTTALGQCLAAVPELSYHYEPAITKAASRYVYRKLWTFEEARDFYCTTYRWLVRLHLDGGLRFAERTLRNSFIMPFLSEAFPNAQFVHLVRDGRDAARLLRARPNFRADRADSGDREVGGYAHGPYARFWVEPERVHVFEDTSDLHRCVWTWRCHVEAILDAARNLADAQYLEVRYEDLARDPDAEADRMLDFLEIDAATSRARFHEAAEHATDPLHAPQDVPPETPLSPKEAALVEDEAGDLFDRLGYAVRVEG
jgi:hypothetical protein